MAELKALGVTPVMLTGDNEATAKTIAKEAGIDEAQGNLLPEDRQQQEHGLDAQRQADVLPQHGMGSARQPDRLGDAAQVIVHDEIGRAHV